MRGNSLVQAKNKGTPYTHLIIENFNLLGTNVAKERSKLRKSSAELKKGFEALKYWQNLLVSKSLSVNQRKEIESKITQINAILNPVFSDPKAEYTFTQQKLAAKHGLVIEFAEEYSSSEFNSVEKEYVLGRKTSDFTRYLKLRDARISQTLRQLEKQSNGAVNAIVTLGSLHVGAQEKLNRNSFANARVVYSK